MFKDLVNEINQLIRKNSWFDFHVIKYDGNQLILGGSTDLTYYHNLELIFEDVFYASIYFKEWGTNAKEPVIEIPTEKLNFDLNMKLEIEQGFQIFILHTDNYKNDILIVAKNLIYNTDTVYYYERKDLKAGERLADFVKIIKN